MIFDPADHTLLEMPSSLDCALTFLVSYLPAWPVVVEPQGLSVSCDPGGVASQVLCCAIWSHKASHFLAAPQSQGLPVTYPLFSALIPPASCWFSDEPSANLQPSHLLLWPLFLGFFCLPLSWTCTLESCGVWQLHQCLNVGLPFNSAIALLCVHPREMKACKHLHKNVAPEGHSSIIYHRLESGDNRFQWC